MLKTMRLTPKQDRFVDEYLVDLNATQAAIRAGYSTKTAKAIGHENLAKPNLAEAIQEAMAERSKRTEVSQDRVVKELARIAFASLGDVIKWGPTGTKVRPSTELSEDVGAAVYEVSETRTEHGVGVRVKLYDKKGALDSLAKHLGMFVERHQVAARVEQAERVPVDPLDPVLAELAVQMAERRAEIEHHRYLEALPSSNSVRGSETKLTNG